MLCSKPFSGTRKWEDFLTVSVFQDHRAQIKFDIVTVQMLCSSTNSNRERRRRRGSKSNSGSTLITQSLKLEIKTKAI